jgi:hypothetical protein
MSWLVAVSVKNFNLDFNSFLAASILHSLVDARIPAASPHDPEPWSADTWKP